ncbi:MAG TPA: hypothetical protein VKT77_09495 [Chthonomonadaceae bacterium]|nr:hypothetical protein [Chthonomonadaceae bacterium]
MRRTHRAIGLALAPIVALAIGLSARPAAKRGPFSPEAWPPTIDATKRVHFISIDGELIAPNDNWAPNLRILTGGDHPTERVTVGGHTGVRIAGFKFNTADDQYPMWAREHTVDILLQIYGDDALINRDRTLKDFNFLTGTLPEPIAVDGGVLPPEAENHRWNWVLFRIPNGLRHMDGGRLIGTIHPKARLDPAIAEVSKNSGQNGGTIRMDGLPGAKIRVVAFGQRGAFGEPEQIDHFFPLKK